MAFGKMPFQKQRLVSAETGGQIQAQCRRELWDEAGDSGDWDQPPCGLRAWSAALSKWGQAWGPPWPPSLLPLPCPHPRALVSISHSGSKGAQVQIGANKFHPWLALPCSLQGLGFGSVLSVTKSPGPRTAPPLGKCQWVPLLQALPFGPFADPAEGRRYSPFRVSASGFLVTLGPSCRCPAGRVRPAGYGLIYKVCCN